MADNIAVTPGAGATVAFDDIAGVQYQRVKLAVGADGSATDYAGNTEGTLLASAARTVDTTSPVQTNHNARGALVTIYVSVIGTGTLTCQVVTVDPQSGTWIRLAIITAINATGAWPMMVYPGAVGGGGFVLSAVSGLALPRTWLAHVDHSDASSWTYSVSYQLIV